MDQPLVLAVETSCDETSAAVLRGERELLGHVILSQDVHRLYGGVVPEIAARSHLRAIDDVVGAALAEAGVGLEQIAMVAATAGPGLIGALLVGLTWAKALAYGLDRPFVPVHHMEAHVFATQLEHPSACPPFIALLVSGGHTMLLWVPEWGHYELLGETRDDAAGEAFDKVAKILGLSYPGGPAIQEAALTGNARSYRLPRPMLNSGQTPEQEEYYEFSFSGLKTSVLTRVRDLEARAQLVGERANLAASFQAAVVDVLVSKTMRAVAEYGCTRVVLGGGVAASRSLRESLASALPAGGELFAPSLRLATDNAAMIARAGWFHWQRAELGDWSTTARADLPFPGLVRRHAGVGAC